MPACFTLRIAAAAAALALLTGATEPPGPLERLLATPELVAPAVVMLGLDGAGRMTVPVSVAGSTPFDFVVDTGAERTVLSTELARQLGLRAGPPLRLLSLTGAVRTPSVHVPDLDFGGGPVTGVVAPAIAGRHIGAAGIVGLDGLQDKRVLLDFQHGTMRLEDAAEIPEERWDADTIVVRARSRYGQLVLADAEFEGTRVQLILDTGAEVSIGNGALARLLSRRGAGTMGLVSVTGGAMTAETRIIGRIRIGTVQLSNLPVAFADAPPFARFGLANRPAMLLGMDALSLFNRVSIDFVRRRIRLEAEDLAPGRAALFAAGRNTPSFVRAGRLVRED